MPDPLWDAIYAKSEAYAYSAAGDIAQAVENMLRARGIEQIAIDLGYEVREGWLGPPHPKFEHCTGMTWSIQPFAEDPPCLVLIDRRETTDG